MVTKTLRVQTDANFVTKGSPILNSELDNTLISLNNDIIAKLPLTGGTLTGKLNLVSASTGGASASIVPGVAPTAIASGDLWATSSGMYYQLGSTTYSFALLNGGVLDNVAIGTNTQSSGSFSYVLGYSTTNTTPNLSFNASNCGSAFGVSASGSDFQTIVQNKSGTVGASTTNVVNNNLGTNSSYYAEFGMNSSVYTTGTPSDFFSINNGIYFSGHDGDITYGSGNGFKTYFSYGSSGQYSHVINSSGAIGLSTNLGSTPSVTGTNGYGAVGQVMSSNGDSAPTSWNDPSVKVTQNSGSTVVYPMFALASGIVIPFIDGSGTPLSYVPSTGIFSAKNITIAQNLIVNGGNLSSSAATVNLFNSATTLNIGNASTNINLGTSGTTTNITGILLNNSKPLLSPYSTAMAATLFGAF